MVCASRQFHLPHDMNICATVIPAFPFSHSLLGVDHFKKMDETLLSRQGRLSIHLRPSSIGITFIWHVDFGCKIQVKMYESERILGLSVTMNGSSILFINVYFPVACHEKYEEYMMCLGIVSSILESHE